MFHRLAVVAPDAGFVLSRIPARAVDHALSFVPGTATPHLVAWADRMVGR